MRIGIVNDMVMVVELLRRIVSSVPDYEVAWLAYDGAEAVKRCAIDTPDLILMDLIMPVMDGVEATYRIMQSTPCAILVVTASVMGNISKVFEAMGHGALDVVRTPALGSDPSSQGIEALLQKIETIARLVGKSNALASNSRPEDEGEEVLQPQGVPPLIAIGASTGGPLALAQILSQFPADLPAAVVVIQHVDPGFAEGFVRWLSQHCPLSIRVAKEGDIPTQGVVSVAGTNDHLVLSKGRKLLYTRHPQESVYRPSVDVFFDSINGHWPSKGVAVLLTGMGRDGARGMLSLRNNGWHTIAQDQKSCVVYGMPKAAIEMKAAQEVLPLSKIAPSITSRVFAERSVGDRSKR